MKCLHTYMCGPINDEVRVGYEYFITFVDDFSRYFYAYLTYKKSKSFDMFKEFKVEVERQLGKPWKALWSNRGREYLSAKFKDFLTDYEIVSQFTTIYTP